LITGFSAEASPPPRFAATDICRHLPDVIMFIYNHRTAVCIVARDASFPSLLHPIRLAADAYQEALPDRSIGKQTFRKTGR
jgi:hypothetical protein